MQAWWTRTALVYPCLGSSLFFYQDWRTALQINFSWLAVILSQSLNYVLHAFLDFSICARWSEVILMCLPFFFLEFWHFNYDVTWGYSFLVMLFGDWNASCTWMSMSLHRFGIFVLISLNRFPMPLVFYFSSFFYSWILRFGLLIISHNYCMLYSCLFIFSLLLFVCNNSSILSSVTPSVWYYLLILLSTVVCV
jgi:hypothetical protein